MSVLIQGMEMPKEMRTFTIFPNGYVAVYNSFDTFIGETKAIQIPPHGRVIDADKLMKKIFGSSLSGREWSELVLTKDKNELQTALFNLPIMFNNAPTIIPADKEG